MYLVWAGRCALLASCSATSPWKACWSLKPSSCRRLHRLHLQAALGDLEQFEDAEEEEQGGQHS